MRTSIHDKHVNEILNNPKEILGLENIIWSAKEVQLWRRNKLIYVTDLVFIEYVNYNPQWIVVEYKCNDSVRQRDKARHQLRVAKNWWKEFMKETPDLLYVSGTYDIEVIE